MGTAYAQAEEVSYKVESDTRQMINSNKVKKPGFIKRWLLRSVKEAVDSERQQANDIVSRIPSRIDRIGIEPSRIDQPERAIHFTVYNASGGRVIETRRHDRKTDRSTNGLYVITDDKDFGREIDKIIVMEGLK